MARLPLKVEIRVDEILHSSMGGRVSARKEEIDHSWYQNSGPSLV